MEDFYRAMTTYINSKKPEKICKHERTFYWCGWRACVECGLCIHKVFSQDIYSHLRGYVIKPKENRFPKIRETMLDIMCAISRKGSTWEDGVYRYYEPPEAGLPRELFDHMRELCLKCMDLEKNVNVIGVVYALRCCGRK